MVVMRRGRSLRPKRPNMSAARAEASQAPSRINVKGWLMRRVPRAKQERPDCGNRFHRSFPDACNGAKRSGRRSGTQRKKPPRSGSLSVQLVVKVAPIRVHALDQRDLPGAAPFLDRVLAVARL